MDKNIFIFKIDKSNNKDKVLSFIYSKCKDSEYDIDIFEQERFDSLIFAETTKLVADIIQSHENVLLYLSPDKIETQKC